MLRRVLALVFSLSLCASETPPSGASVLVPQLLRLSAAPWSLPAYGLSPGADVSLTLRSWASGKPVASASGKADAAGFALLSLSPSAELTAAGPHALEAQSGEWRNASNCTLVSPAPFLTLVLDKRIYKPGDTVLVRALALDGALRPLGGTRLRVSLRDAGGWLVAEETGVCDAFGVLSAEFPTASEPPLGGWKAVVVALPSLGEPVETPFRIERYVLPTFAVSLQPEKTFLVKPPRAAEARLRGTLRVARTNGEALGGAAVTLTVTQTVGWAGGGRRSLAMMLAAAVAPRWSAGFNASGPSLPLATLELRLLEDASGVLPFSAALPAGSIQWGDGAAPPGATPPLRVTARVVETATGEEQSGDASVSPTAHPLRVSLLASPACKPGLPWLVRVKVSAPDGGPIPGRQADGAQLSITATTRSGLQLLNKALPLVLDAGGEQLVAVDMPFDGDAGCCNRSAAFAGDWEAQSCCLASVSAQLGFVSERGARRAAASSLVAHAYANVPDGPTTHFLSLGAPQMAAGRLTFTPAATLDAAPLGWAVLQPGAGGGALSAGVGEAGRNVSAPLPPLAVAGGPAYLVAWMRAGDALVFDHSQLNAASAPEAATAASQLPAALSAAFSGGSARPGETVNVSAAGAPGCRVFFASTDASVALMADGEAALNASGILAGAAAAAAAALVAAGGGEGIEACWNQPEWWVAAASLATALQQPACAQGAPAGGGFAMEGIRFKGGAMNARPEQNDMGAMPMMMAAASAAGGGAAAAAPEPPRERSSFPETWVWASADADASGLASLPGLVVPDSLTSWTLSAFSLHPTQGVAVAPPPPPLAVTQLLSLRLSLPPSAIRGERLRLRAALYSTLPRAITATVRLLLDDCPAEGCALRLDGGAATQTVSLAAGAAGAPAAGGLFFDVTPVRLGVVRVRLSASADGGGGEGDALSQPLTVMCEGLPGEAARSALLNASDPRSAPLRLAAPPPPGALPDSVRTTLRVTGDVMGPSLQGLGQLLSVPTGCGEQTMIGVAPSVAVLRYSAALPSPLPAQLLAQARQHAATGWQRELTYRHADGSFSAFGASDGEGSTWLTAFVLRVFSSASSFVTIDSEALAQAARWLVSLQASDGSFRSVGSVVHTDMVGGGGQGNVSLTAFVLTALLEANSSQTAPLEAAVTAALAYLLLPLPPQASGDGAGGAYARHLRAHALALACGKGRAAACDPADASLGDLMGRLAADDEGGLPHWRARAASAAAEPAAATPPGDIELTGYGVLALLSRGRVGDASAPARWLLTQRTGYGGYSSTQDTVVGLAACAAFSAAARAPPVALSLAVARGGEVIASLRVNASNAGVLQQIEVPSGADLEVTGAGEGVALLQLVTRYNTLPPASSPGAASSGEAAAFAVVSEALNITSVASRRSLLEGDDGGATVLLHHRTCFARAAGGGADDGMVLLRVQLFSGYTAVAASLAALQASSPALVKRVEAAPDGRGVSIYLERVAAADGGGGVCLGFDAVRSQRVGELAPASASVHAYYKPSQRGAASLPASAVRPAAARPPSGVTPAPAGTFTAAAAAHPAPTARGRRASWRRRAVAVPVLAAACAAALALLLLPKQAARATARAWELARATARAVARRRA